LIEFGLAGAKRNPLFDAESPEIRNSRIGIALKTVSVFTVYSLFTLAVYEFLARFDFWIGLAMALAFTVVQALAILILMATLIVLRLVDRVRDRRSAAAVPQIRSLLATQALGGNEIDALSKLLSEFPHPFEQAFTEVISTFRDDGQNRLGQAARRLGLTERWIKKAACRNVQKRRRNIACLGAAGGTEVSRVLLRALRDPSEVIRLEAALALVRAGNPGEIQEVCEYALQQNKLTRFVLTESLRPHAQPLCREILRRYLQCGQPARIVACLETIEAWRVALAVPEVPFLLRHVSPTVREHAFRVVPYLSSAENLQNEILAGIADPEENVRRAAIVVASRMKIAAALPLLEQALKASSGSIALTSAFSLAEMGRAGVEVLEQTVKSGHASIASALEALERFRVGRLEHANL
jgi:hypothetical protein